MFIWINQFFLHNTIRYQHPERYVKGSSPECLTIWGCLLEVWILVTVNVAVLFSQEGETVEAIHKAEARLLVGNRSTREMFPFPNTCFCVHFSNLHDKEEIIRVFVMLPLNGYLIRFFRLYSENKIASW